MAMPKVSRSSRTKGAPYETTTTIVWPAPVGALGPVGKLYAC